jgi:hypothetical protein
MPDDTRDWSNGDRATGTGIGTPDVDTGDPSTLGKEDREWHRSDKGGSSEFLDEDDMTGSDVAHQDIPGRDNVND